MLAGVTPATRGKIDVKGRIFPMIELNAGIHPELSGRENVYFLGTVMGLSRADMHKRMNQIEEFCELEEWFDQPVRKYSSGMLARLGFAVAMNIEADILLIDEVLSVGDISFQRKCMEAMAKIQRADVTILLVSHVIQISERVCSKGFWLDKGKLMSFSDMRSVASQYYQQSIHHEFIRQQKDAHPAIYKDTGQIVFDSITILDNDGKPSKQVETGKAMSIRMEYTLTEPVEDLLIYFGFLTVEMIRLGRFSSSGEPSPPADRMKGVVECTIPTCTLLPGSYSLFVSAGTPEFNFFKGENLLLFQVTDPSFDYIQQNFDYIVFDTEWNYSSRP